MSSLIFIVFLVCLISASNILLQNSHADDSSDYTVAKIEWPDECYSLSHFAPVRIIDPDMNTNATLPETITVDSWSDYDENRIRSAILTETGNSTGIFEGLIALGEIGDEGIGSRIYVGIGNNIFVSYYDNTTPDSHPFSSMYVMDSTTIKMTVWDYPSKKWYNGQQYEYDPCILEILKQADDSGEDMSWLKVIFPPPQQQIQSGISFSNIVCKENLILIQKHDSSPACVKPETKEKLLERRWMQTSSSYELKQYVKVSTVGYKYNQMVNEPITDFYVKIEGTGYNYHPPRIWISDMNNKTIWNNDHITYLGTGRTLPGNFCKEYTFNDVGGPVIINATGNYELLVSFGEETTSYGLYVKANKTSYNYPTHDEHCSTTLSEQVNGYDNFILTISNQSMDRDTVDMLVWIDGIITIDTVFESDSQHNFNDYGFLLTEGTHIISAKIKNERHVFEQNFVINGTQYGYLSYWYDDEKDNPHFEFIIDDEKFGFL